MCEYALETCYSWIHPRIPTYINDNAWQKYERVPPVDVCRDVPHQKNAVIIFSFFLKKRKKACPITTSMAVKASGGGVERLD